MKRGIIVALLVAVACETAAPEYTGRATALVEAESDTVISDTLEYHPVRLGQDGAILPWYSADPGQSYDHVLKLVWQFWKNMETDSLGIPYYMYHQVWSPEHDRRGLGGDQLQMALSSWDLYYNYTGDEALIENMKFMADYYLEHSLSPPDSKWPHLPYPYNMDTHSGEYDGDMIIGVGFTQPDKAGSFGTELVKLYKKTGERRYLDAAVNIANTLAAHVQPGDNDHSPWPFKVHAETGETGIITETEVWYEGMAEDLKKSGREYKLSGYTTNWTGTLELFSALIELEEGNTGAYTNAFAIALGWLKTYPAKTNKWGPFFEDVPRWSDTQINAVTYAMYLLENPQADADWKATVKSIFEWVHSELDDNRYGKYGVVAIDEQTAYRQPGNSHSARQASMELRYWELTGDTTYLRNAVRMLHWATYMVDHDGKNFYPTNAVWLTDGYGDYVQHYLRAMAAAPELAPANADHLLRSSSVIQKISYQPSLTSYSTFDSSSEEVFRLTSEPREVRVNGEKLRKMDGKSAAGWLWLAMEEGGVLKIKQNSGSEIEIVK